MEKIAAPVDGIEFDWFTKIVGFRTLRGDTLWIRRIPPLD